MNDWRLRFRRWHLNKEPLSLPGELVVPFITLVAGLGIGFAADLDIDFEAIGTLKWLIWASICLMVICTGAVIYVTRYVLQSSQPNRLRVKVVHSNDVFEDGPIYQALQEATIRAKSSIYILSRAKPNLDPDEMSEDRKRYYKILEKIIHLNERSGFKYKRLIQANGFGPDDKRITLSSEHTDVVMLNHCISTREKYQKRIKVTVDIDAIPCILPCLDIMVIDRLQVVFLIPHVIESQNGFENHGIHTAIFITDPSRELGENMEDLFATLARKNFEISAFDTTTSKQESKEIDKIKNFFAQNGWTQVEISPGKKAYKHPDSKEVFEFLPQ